MNFCETKGTIRRGRIRLRGKRYAEQEYRLFRLRLLHVQPELPPAIKNCNNCTLNECAGPMLKVTVICDPGASLTTAREAPTLSSLVAPRSRATRPSGFPI